VNKTIARIGPADHSRRMTLEGFDEAEGQESYLDSERNPAVAAYLTPPPEHEDKSLWRRWVPEIVIDVVSLGSRHANSSEKPAEYLRFGVEEYGINDAEKRAMTVMCRSRGRWAKTTIRPPAFDRTTLLPGLDFSVEAVFKTAGFA
jgi:Uma2 family endonuclease